MHLVATRYRAFTITSLRFIPTSRHSLNNVINANTILSHDVRGLFVKYVKTGNYIDDVTQYTRDVLNGIRCLSLIWGTN